MSDMLFSMKEKPRPPRSRCGSGGRAGEYVRLRAVETLMAARLTDEPAAEAWVLAYRKGWDDALEFCIRAERAINENDNDKEEG